MALKELLTDPANFKYNSRSLKFGNDRPGGGSSKQPYIKTPLPKVDSDPSTTFPDFLLRDPKNALNDRVDDLARISKFLVSREGGLFIAKQELLSRANPIVPGKPNRSNPVSGYYNPLMTLAQVAASGTGLHIEKQGLFPIFDKYEKYEYQYKNLFNFNSTNRLTVLFKTKVGDLTAGDPTFRKINLFYGQPEYTGVSRDPNSILQYQGGANSFGVGKTTIPFADNRVYDGSNQQKQARALATSNQKASLVNYDYTRYLGVSNKAIDLGYAATTETGLGNYLNNQINGNNTGFTFDPNVYYTKATFPDTSTQKTTSLGVFTLTQRQLVSRTPIGRDGTTSYLTGTGITDFRKQIRETYTQEEDKVKQDQLGVIYFDYQSPKVNREERIGLGNPGKRTRNRGKLTNYDNSTVDRINILPPYYSDVVADPDTLTRDLVKFRFEIIDNTSPGHSTFLHFRAFLGAINDNFKSEWDSTKYVGRGEKFYNYTGFSRDISFSFKVHPQSRAEMRSIYQKLNLLAASLAPDYRNGYMKGNLIRLTIGDYLYIVPGFITALTYNIPEEAAWEIALNSPEGGSDLGLLETPKYFDVNVSFTAIHDFAPQLGTTVKTAFITPQAATKDGNAYLGGVTGSGFTDRDTSYVRTTTNGTTDLNSDTAANLKQFATIAPPPVTIQTVEQTTNVTGPPPTGNNPVLTLS
jgi:hypothetical protein